MCLPRSRPRPLPRARRTAFVPLAALLLLGACRGERRDPAIGFTYSFGDPALVAFMQAELDRVRPEDAPRIRVVSADSGGWTALAGTILAAEVKRATLLAGDADVVAVVGLGGSREALQVVPVYREAHLAQLVPTATSRLLSGAGDWTFVMVPNDSVQGEFIGAYADSVLGARSVAVFYVPDEYGIGLAAGTAAALDARGLALLDRVPVRLTLDCLLPGAPAVYADHAAQLALRGTPDAVVLAMRTTEAACMARALRARWPRVALVAGDGTYLDSGLLHRAGVAAEGLHIVAFWHPGIPADASRAYAAAYQAALGRWPRHADAVFYDAVRLAADAIWSVGADRERVHRYILSLGRGRPAYQGITGEIAFTPGHVRPLWMTRVHGETTELVRP
jgi:ABC-type branched-subunit amino acid transport system substrate-binding protein